MFASIKVLIRNMDLCALQALPKTVPCCKKVVIIAVKNLRACQNSVQNTHEYLETISDGPLTITKPSQVPGGN